MLILATVAEKIQVTSSAGVTVDVHASVMNLTGATAGSQVVTPGSQNTAFTTATTLDVVDPPAASYWKNVKVLIIRNKHAATPTNITVSHVGAITTVELFKDTLLADGEIHYVDGVGFTVL